MAARLRFLVPQSTTNYIKNPSARFDTTDINADGAAVTRSLDEARFNIASYKVVTNGAVLNEGFYYRVNALEGINDILTVSVYLIGEGTARIRLIDNPAGKEWQSTDTEILSDLWTRIEVTGRSTGSNDMRLYVETNGLVAQAATFYADGLQMERREAATTFCDGDLEGCFWNGIEHASTSTRNADTRAGGRWIEVAGPSCEDKDLYMTVAGGMGVGPIMNQIQPYADAPGSYFQNFKALDRVITLTFHAKQDQRPRTNALPSLQALHELRQQLIDLVKPDKTADRKPFLLEYQDGEKPLYLQVRYEAGLEGEWDIRNHFYNSFPLRLLAVSPMYREDNQYVSELNIREEQTINYIVRRFDGEWQEMNGGFNNLVRDIAVGSRGEIIAVGDFTVANNDASAIDPTIPANYIAYWDGEKWNQYGVGANAAIYSVDIAPNGDIYVTGSFTSIGGVAANRVAYWNGSSWNAMGTGLADDTGKAIKVAPNGDVYVGGGFSQAGGVANTNRIARWTGSWVSVGSGLDDECLTIDITPDGSAVYFGGSFTADNGILTLRRVAVYYPLIASIEEPGDGFDSDVHKISISESGIVYAVGNFTEDSQANLVLLYIASWNGAVWSNVGIGGNSTIRDIALDNKGNFIPVGDFSIIGGENARYAALWNNSDYVILDVELDNPCYAVAIDKQDNYYLAPNGTSARWAKRTTIDNIGTAEATPKIYIKGPCTLIWLENQTTRKRIYADLDILEDEEVFIDVGLGTVESTVRGNLAYAINPGSDFRAWKLAPGENIISMLMTDDIGAFAQISYVPQHWSADASPDVQDL